MIMLKSQSNKLRKSKMTILSRMKKRMEMRMVIRIKPLMKMMRKKP